MSRTSGTHFQGPLLGSDRAGAGMFEDMPLGVVDQIRSPYKIYYEDFSEQMANAQALLTGWTVTDTGGGTPAETVTNDGTMALVLDLSAGADDGVELQYDIVRDVTGVTGMHDVIPEMTSSATLMDNREIFFQVRMATASDSATDNDVKWLLGIFTKDTSLLSTTTGLPTVVAGGGFGFHKAELGAVTVVSTEAAITTAGTACVPAHTELAQTVTVNNWHTYAARCRVIDADAGTGVTEFWVDGISRGTLTTVPFDSTEVYSFSIAACNGPAQVADISIDYILTGITRPGLTWPYTPSASNVW